MMEIIKKDKFFELYNQVKNKKIDINDLDKDVAIKILYMINEEMRFYKKKLD